MNPKLFRPLAFLLCVACGPADPRPASEQHDEVAGPALLIADDVWVTRRALRSFLKVARGRGLSRLCLPPSRLLSLFAPLQDVPTDSAGRTTPGLSGVVRLGAGCLYSVGTGRIGM